jgi:hypothetical protein
VTNFTAHVTASSARPELNADDSVSKVMMEILWQEELSHLEAVDEILSGRRA